MAANLELHCCFFFPGGRCESSSVAQTKSPRLADAQDAGTAGVIASTSEEALPVRRNDPGMSSQVYNYGHPALGHARFLVPAYVMYDRFEKVSMMEATFSFMKATLSVATYPSLAEHNRSRNVSVADVEKVANCC